MTRRHLFEIGRDGLVLDGQPVREAKPLGWYAEQLGPTPIRTEVPAIAKLRPDLSNKWHVFDELGLVLNEHHAHRLIFAIAFRLTPEAGEDQPAKTFTGELRLFGETIVGGESEGELEKRGIRPDRVAVHQWSFDLGPFSVGLAFDRLRRTDKPWVRARPHRLVAVHFDILTPEHRALTGR